MIRTAVALCAALLLATACTSRAQSGATALQTLEKSAPALKERHPHGAVEAMLGDQQLQWQIHVWDADRQNTTAYRVEADGTVHATSTITAAHEVVPILDLASGSMPKVIDSPEALQKADEYGGGTFTQETRVVMWSMQLGGQSGRPVWTVQYGQPTLAQQQRLTIVIDAISAELVSQSRNG